MLQTKDFTAIKYVDGKTNTFTFYLRITENSVDLSNNTSNVTVQALLQQTKSDICFENKFAGVSCTVNGKSLFSDYQLRSLKGSDPHCYYTWTGDMRHDALGALELDVSGKFWLSASGQSLPGTINISGQRMTLTPISRFSAVGASDANIGANTTIVIVPASNIYRHSIRYTFGALTGYILPDGSISETEATFQERVISFPIPETFYDQMPTVKQRLCTLVVTTYVDQTYLGKNQATFRVTTDPESCGPLLEASVQDCNENTLSATGNENTLVKFCSTALCQADVQCRYGATLKSVTVNGISLDESEQIPLTETGTYTFAVTDSRGYQTKQVVEKPLLPYIRLTCNPTARRTAPTTGQVALTVTGNCFCGSFGAEANSLTGACRVDTGSWQPFEMEIREDHSYETTILLEGLGYETGHSIEVAVTDRMETATAKTFVGRGIPVFDWGEDYFNFHVPVHFGAGTTGLT